MALQGYKGAVYAQSGIAAAFTNLPCSDVSLSQIPAAPIRTVYRLNDITKRFWDSTVAPVVQTSPDNVTYTTQAANLYTINYLGGFITFTAALAVGSFVRVSANAFPMAPLADVEMWDIAVARGKIETTSVNNVGGWQTFIPGIGTATVNVSRYYADPFYATNIIAPGVMIEMSLYTDASAGQAGPRWDVYSYETDFKLKVARGAAVMAGATFICTGGMSFNAS